MMFLVWMIVFTISCTSSKMHTTAEVKALKDIMNDSVFEFEAQTANPMMTQGMNSISNAGLLPPGSTSGMIQLLGITNYLKVKGDSVMANLPFYGERRFGGGYGSSTGIEFEGIPTSYTQVYNEEKNRYDIRFDISNDMEVYQVNLAVFPSMTANVSVASNQRNVIRYSGTIRSPKKEAKVQGEQ